MSEVKSALRDALKLLPGEAAAVCRTERGGLGPGCVLSSSEVGDEDEEAPVVDVRAATVSPAAAGGPEPGGGSAAPSGRDNAPRQRRAGTGDCDSHRISGPKPEWAAETRESLGRSVGTPSRGTDAVQCPSVLYVLQLLLCSSRATHERNGMGPTAPWEGTLTPLVLRAVFSVAPTLLLPFVRWVTGLPPLGTHSASIACASASLAMQLSIGVSFVTAYVEVVHVDLSRRLFWQRALGLLLYTEVASTRALHRLAQAARAAHPGGKIPHTAAPPPAPRPTAWASEAKVAPAGAWDPASAADPISSGSSTAAATTHPEHSAIHSSQSQPPGTEEARSESQGLSVMFDGSEPPEAHDEVHLQARMREVRAPPALTFRRLTRPAHRHASRPCPARASTPRRAASCGGAACTFCASTPPARTPSPRSRRYRRPCLASASSTTCA